jgi:hypothetical protein
MSVLVKAVTMGYYDHKRRREGQEFMMAEADLKYDKQGKLLSPRWVSVISDASVTKPAKAARSQKKEVEQSTTDDVI